MSYQPSTTSKPTYQPLPFSTQLDEVDKALFEYRYRKQHTGFSHQQKQQQQQQQTQQHFNVNNNMKYHNNGKHNRGNNYHHGNKQHNQANYNHINNFNNASYYGNGIPINTAVATASVAQPVRQQQQQQTMFNSTSPTLYQPINNNGYLFNSNSGANANVNVNVNVNTASKLNEFEEAFPLNSRLVDNVNLSSSVSSGSNSSYSSFNDGDFIFNNGKNINGGNGSLSGASGFGGLGGSAGFGSGFNDLNFGAHRANGEKSFGFLNIWGNDMSVWS